MMLGQNGYQKEIILNEPKKLIFKFIIDGKDWVVSNKYSIERDGNGIENNVVDETDFIEVESSERATKEEMQAIDKGAKENTISNEPLSQVVTSGSSFASVSVPGHLSDGELVGGDTSSSMAIIDKDEGSEPVISTCPSTTNTSIVNLNTGTTEQVGGDGGGQVGASSKTVSDSPLRSTVPGSYPHSEPFNDAGISKVKDASSRRDGLLSKIKSLFKY